MLSREIEEELVEFVQEENSHNDRLTSSCAYIADGELIPGTPAKKDEFKKGKKIWYSNRVVVVAKSYLEEIEGQR